MRFPLKLKPIFREIALFYTNFTTNSRICEAKSRGITFLPASATPSSQNNRQNTQPLIVRTYLVILQSQQHEIELVTRLGSPAGKRTLTSFWGISSSPSNGLFCTGTLPTACRPEPLRLWTTPVRRRPLSTKFLVATWGRMSPVSSADTSRPLSNILWTSCWTSVRFQPLKRLCGNTSDRSESTTTCTSARGARSKFQPQRGRWISLFAIFWFAENSDFSNYIIA